MFCRNVSFDFGLFVVMGPGCLLMSADSISKLTLANVAINMLVLWGSKKRGRHSDVCKNVTSFGFSYKISPDESHRNQSVLKAPEKVGQCLIY